MRPDSRTPASATFSVFVPITIVPMTNAPRQKASQPKMAIFRWCALQCAIRAEMLRGSDMVKPPPPRSRLSINSRREAGQTKVAEGTYFSGLSSRSKNAITRRSYSVGCASVPPMCPEPGTSQISFGPRAAA